MEWGMTARPASSKRPNGLLLRLSIAAAVALGVLGGCATRKRLPAEPAGTIVQAAPMPGPIRFLVFRDTEALAEEGRRSIEREKAWLAAHGQQGPLPPASLLAISGGGDAGAFGAGLLNGWTASGT